MSDNLKEKVNAIGERLKINGAEVGRKVSAGMSSMSFKMKEFFQEPNQADKLVSDATSESLDEPNWDMILHVCDLVNAEKVQTCEAVRAIKKRVMVKSPRGQYLALVLLEALVKNCDKGFFEVATERVLDEMVKIVDVDSDQSFVSCKDKALRMIQCWGESSTELRYLPVYEETYKSLKARGVRFPGCHDERLDHVLPPSGSASAPEAGRSLQHLIQHENHFTSYTSQQTKEAFDVARNCSDLLSSVLSSSSPQLTVLQQNLTMTLVQQCRESQSTVHRIIETVGNNEALLFEALQVNDEIHKVLSKYEELKKKKKKPKVSPLKPEPDTMIPVAIEPDESPHFREDALIRKPASSRTGVQGLSHDDMMDDLDEMIFGKKGGDASQWEQDPKKQQSSKYESISL
ncbi:unnamed protein product [Vicia faba]|uniref:TOM1-like protein 2 n=1 Tax=Vicia faba TaxID=3906 RepID=A0AAV1B707_VICFA|nr:unnamed protein product [Vicia faba]